jgi:hypothetical protein
MPVTAAVEGDALRNGTFYAFAHGGGDLVFAVAGNGSADIVLYGADDQRLGHIAVGAEQAHGRFVLDGAPAGELVLEAVAVNGTLDIRSDGAPVDAFRPLTVHVERYVLAQAPRTETGQFGIPFGPREGETIDTTLAVDLLRAPSDLVVLENSMYSSLDIVVTGRSGVVYEASEGGSAVGAPSMVFQVVQTGEKKLENVRDGHLVARVQATDFEGTLLLEARSYSRAAVAKGGAYEADAGLVPRFTYGVLPDQPVAFEVRAGATVLYLWQEDSQDADREETTCSEVGQDNVPSQDCEPAYAHVALFGPADQRVATVAVPREGTLAIPVGEAGPGSWVAVLLDGQATLGADRVPGDFELHPIDVVEAVSPASAAGENGTEYAQGRRPLDVSGIAFRLQETQMQDSATGDLPIDGTLGLFGSCEEAAVSVLLDGETIGAWGYDLGRYSSGTPVLAIDPSTLLGDGDLEVAFSDFGPNCPRLGVLVQGYER